MKKLSLIIIGIFLLIIFPNKADAASLGLTFSCSNVTVGQTTTCTLKGSSGELIKGFAANISITGGASIESVSTGSGWGSMENSSSYIAYYAQGAGKTGSFNIATFNIRANSVGNVTINATGIKFDDGNDEFNGSAARGTFVVNAAATQPPATQPRPTTKPTTKPTTATPTTIPQTDPVGTELILDSVKVGDFEVQYLEGKYYVTVGYDTESVNVEAVANPNLTVIGGGVRTLAVGKNVVEIILRNELNQSATVQVIITRPEDTNNYTTYLTELKIVDYDFKFNKDTLEYTVYVPATVKELFVIAKSDNVDVNIMGDGLQSLVNGNNELHIKVQYGDKAETNYVIYIKRTYTSVIMYGVIALLSIGLIGSILYFTNKLKEKTIANKEEKNKILAMANRAVAESKDNVTLNGQSVVSPSNAATSPIVNTTPVTPTTSPISQELTPTVQVVEKRVPTNPVAVATSTVNPVQQSPNVAQTNVKVVRTLDRQPIKVNRTPIKTNGAKQVVINTGKQN